MMRMRTRMMDEDNEEESGRVGSGRVGPGWAANKRRSERANERTMGGGLTIHNNQPHGQMHSWHREG
jgi:hypothetical protein